jgi:hypothetical protein
MIPGFIGRALSFKESDHSFVVSSVSPAEALIAINLTQANNQRECIFTRLEQDWKKPPESRKCLWSCILVFPEMVILGDLGRFQRSGGQEQ